MDMLTSSPAVMVLSLDNRKLLVSLSLVDMLTSRNDGDEDDLMEFVM